MRPQVGLLSPTHVLVLNKFNVVPHHCLVITRQFENQSDPLNARDLAAAQRVLAAMPQGGLAFYNCGEHSGRSQPHKHMQVGVRAECHGGVGAMRWGVCILGAVIDRAMLCHTPHRSRCNWHSLTPSAHTSLGSVCDFTMRCGVPPCVAVLLRQVVPLPFHEGGDPQPPVQALILAAAAAVNAQPLQPVEVRGMPCVTYAAQLPEGATPEQVEAAYTSLMALLPPQASYNVLLTRTTLMLCPRRAEACGPCAIKWVPGAEQLDAAAHTTGVGCRL